MIAKFNERLKTFLFYLEKTTMMFLAYYWLLLDQGLSLCSLSIWTTPVTPRSSQDFRCFNNSSKTLDVFLLLYCSAPENLFRIQITLCEGCHRNPY